MKQKGNMECECQVNQGVFLYNIFNEQIKAVMAKQFSDLTMLDLDPAVIINVFERYIEPISSTVDWRAMKMQLKYSTVLDAGSAGGYTSAEKIIYYDETIEKEKNTLISEIR